MMQMVSAVPVFLMLGCVAGLAVLLFSIGRICNPRQFVGPVQKMPYESGMDPIHDTRRRFDVRFHLIAIAFLVFDVEVLFLYPWAVAAKRPGDAQTSVAQASVSVNMTQVGLASSDGNKSASESLANDSAAAAYDITAAVRDGLASDRHIVFAGAMVFIALLALGFVYDWRKGVFQWR